MMYGQPAQWGLLPARQLPAAAFHQQQYLHAGAQHLQPFPPNGIGNNQLLHFNANPHFGNGFTQ
jgi:hypothetical protein